MKTISRLFFSVVIPTCNRNELLSVCLEGLLPGCQNMESDLYEVIVSDDSKNGSAKELIQKQFPRITWIKGPEKGPAANRNCGASIAAGDWLVFLDDDCIPNCALLRSYMEAIKEARGIEVFEGMIKAEGITNNPLMHAPVNQTGGLLWSCNFCIRKRTFFELEGFDEKFKYAHLEDIDLRDRLSAKGLEMRFVPKSYVTHPWRVIINGKRLGRMHESDIYYLQSKQGVELSITSYFKRLYYYRFKRLFSYPFSIHSLILVKELMIESWILANNFSKWKKLYPVKKPAR